MTEPTPMTRELLQRLHLDCGDEIRIYCHEEANAAGALLHRAGIRGPGMPEALATLNACLADNLDTVSARCVNLLVHEPALRRPNYEDWQDSDDTADQVTERLEPHALRAEVVPTRPNPNPKPRVHQHLQRRDVEAKPNLPFEKHAFQLHHGNANPEPLHHQLDSSHHHHHNVAFWLVVLPFFCLGVVVFVQHIAKFLRRRHFRPLPDHQQQ